MKNFRVIKFMKSVDADSSSEEVVGTCDYPDHLLVPNIGDVIDMMDDDNIRRFGIVSKRTITVRTEFTEIKITVNIN